MKRVRVVGGGPSSVLFALTYKKYHPSDLVSLYEKDSAVLKRVLVSGNGRANFFNEKYLSGTALSAFYDGKEENIGFTKEEAEEFLNFLKEDLNFSYYSDPEGRFYPFSNLSSSLKDALVRGLKKEGIEVFTDSEVKKVNPERKTILVNGKELPYDVLFCGIGNEAFDRKEGSVSSFFQNLGLKITPSSPALCPLATVERIPPVLVGTRLKGKLNLYKKERKIYEENGELLFKKDGISGICVFDASLFIDRPEDYTVRFDPFEHDGVKVSIRKGESMDGLSGIFPYPFVEALKKSGYKNIDEESVRKFLTFKIRCKYPLKFSQIAKGGVSLSEVTPNFALKQYPGILIGGESVDQHAICGGFNMGFAFLSGFRAAKPLP